MLLNWMLSCLEKVNARIFLQENKIESSERPSRIQIFSFVILSVTHVILSVTVGFSARSTITDRHTVTVAFRSLEIVVEERGDKGQL